VTLRSGKRTAAAVRTVLLIALLLAAIPVSAAWAAGDDANVALNGSFEELGGDGPADWTRDVHVAGEATSRLTVGEGDAHSGSRFVTIESFRPNDAKWTQTVAVKPDTLYKLSCWIRVERAGSAQAVGANVSVLGVVATSPDLRSAGDWRRVELVGRTGADQRQLTVAVRLGGYGSLNVGKADFDDFRLEELAEAPAGARVASFAPEPDSGSRAADGTPSPGPSHTAYAGWMIAYGLAYAALGAFLLARLRSREAAPAATGPRVGLPLVALTFGGAFVLRLACAPIVRGHPIDVGDFMAWADHAYQEGLANFYNGDIFADYPPGYIYVLYVLGAVRSWLGLDPASPASVLLIKLPAMLADLATAGLVYRTASRLRDERTALLAALLYALNPLVFADSVVWGQMDAVFCLFVALMVVALQDKRLPAAAVFFVVAALIKPQSLMFAPLLLFSVRKRRETAKAALYALAACAVIVLPFAVRQGPLWIFKHYHAMFSLYPYATFNAFNVYALLGANGAQTGQTRLGIPYAGWDLVFLAAIVALTGALLLKSRRDGKMFYAAFLVSMLVFAFKTGLHERYGYTAAALALLSWVRLRDARVLALFVGATLTNFANVAYVLGYALDQNYFIPNGNGFMNLVSLANVCLALYAVRVGYALLIAEPQSPPSAEPGGRPGGRRGRRP